MTRPAKLTPAERAAQYAGKPAKATPATPTQATGSDPERYAWKVDRWGNHNLVVIVVPPQTQAQMRVLYPDAAGIHPLET